MSNWKYGFLLVGLGIMARPVYAHGLDQFVPYVVWPAFPMGLLGGAAAAALGKARKRWLPATFGAYVLLLLAMVFSQQGAYYSFSAGISLAALVLVFCMIFGALPLAASYMVSEFITKRLSGTRGKGEQNHGT